MIHDAQTHEHKNVTNNSLRAMIFKQQNQTGQEENIESIEYWTSTLSMIIMLENVFNVLQVQVSLPGFWQRYLIN